jgi:hypothetical protein
VTKTSQAVSAPTRKDEAQAAIPTVWKIRDNHVIETMVDDDGVTWIKLEWSPKLHLFLALPQHREQAELIQQIKKVGYINTQKWVKMYPQQPELDF